MYLINHIKEGNSFYILNKRFWDDWRSSVGYDSKITLVINLLYREIKYKLSKAAYKQQWIIWGAKFNRFERYVIQ